MPTSSPTPQPAATTPCNRPRYCKGTYPSSSLSSSLCPPLLNPPKLPLPLPHDAVVADVDARLRRLAVDAGTVVDGAVDAVECRAALVLGGGSEEDFEEMSKLERVWWNDGFPGDPDAEVGSTSAVSCLCRPNHVRRLAADDVSCDAASYDCCRSSLRGVFVLVRSGVGTVAPRGPGGKSGTILSFEASISTSSASRTHFRRRV